MEKSQRMEGKCSGCPAILLMRDDGRMRVHNVGGRKGYTCLGVMDPPEWTRPFTGVKKRAKTKN